jgi:hypothetical protein
MFEKLSQALRGNQNAAGPHKKSSGGFGGAVLNVRRRLYKAQESAKSALLPERRAAYKLQEKIKSAVSSGVKSGEKAVKSAVLTGKRKAYKAQVAAGGVVDAGAKKAFSKGKAIAGQGAKSMIRQETKTLEKNPKHVAKLSDFSFKDKAKVFGGTALATAGHFAGIGAAKMGHKNMAKETSAPMRNAKNPVKAKPSQIPMKNAVTPKKASDTQIPMRNAATGPIKIRTTSATTSPLKTAKAKTISRQPAGASMEMKGSNAPKKISTSNVVGNGATTSPLKVAKAKTVSRQPAGASMEMKGSNAPKKASISAQAALINRAGNTSSPMSTKTPGKKKKK